MFPVIIWLVKRLERKKTNEIQSYFQPCDNWLEKLVYNKEGIYLHDGSTA